MTPECERNAKDADRVSVGWAQRFWPVLGRQAVLRADGQHQAVDAPRRTAAEGRAATVIGDVEGGAEKVSCRLNDAAATVRGGVSPTPGSTAARNSNFRSCPRCQKLLAVAAKPKKGSSAGRTSRAGRVHACSMTHGARCGLWPSRRGPARAGCCRPSWTPPSSASSSARQAKD